MNVKIPEMVLKHKRLFHRSAVGWRALGPALTVAKSLAKRDIPGVHITADNFLREKDVVDAMSYWLRVEAVPRTLDETLFLCSIGARIITTHIPHRYTYDDLKPVFLYKIDHPIDRLPPGFDEGFVENDWNLPFTTTYMGCDPPKNEHRVWVVRHSCLDRYFYL